MNQVIKAIAHIFEGGGCASVECIPAFLQVLHRLLQALPVFIANSEPLCMHMKPYMQNKTSLGVKRSH